MGQTPWWTNLVAFVVGIIPPFVIFWLRSRRMREQELWRFYFSEGLSAAISGLQEGMRFVRDRVMEIEHSLRTGAEVERSTGRKWMLRPMPELRLEVRGIDRLGIYGDEARRVVEYAQDCLAGFYGLLRDLCELVNRGYVPCLGGLRLLGGLLTSLELPSVERVIRLLSEMRDEIMLVHKPRRPSDWKRLKGELGKFREEMLELLESAGGGEWPWR